MSGDLRTIRRRITTIRNIQKIAKAMKMVASAKLYKVQPLLNQHRPYVDALWRSMGRIYHPEDAENVFYQKDEGRRPLMLVIASDRGMCGSYNAKVTKLAEGFIREHDGEVDIIYSGKKARDRLKTLGINPLKEFTLPSDLRDPDFVSEIRKFVLKRLEDGSNDSFHVAYTRYLTPMTQEPAIQKLFPMEGDPDFHPDPLNDYTYYEPERKEMLEMLMPVVFDAMMERMLMDSLTSELAARMTAMDGASKNAQDLLEDLTVQYNKARQALITRELMEIISGFEVIS